MSALQGAGTPVRPEDHSSDAPRDLTGMEIRVEPFKASHLPLVAAFSAKYWSRPRNEEYYRWRYLDPQPFSRMFIAIGGDECLGMVFALRKPYLIAGERRFCLEVFDWHCLPGLRGSGVGIRVMRAMMRTGERVISFGGTPDVLSTLPAMRWQNLASLRMYELPIAGDWLEPALRKRVALRVPGERLLLDAAASVWFRPGARQKPIDGQVASGPITEDAALVSLYQGDTGYDLLQVPDTQQFRWLAGYGRASGFGLLRFHTDDRLRGWAMTRLYETSRGLEGAILDVYASAPDTRIYTWMVSEAARYLASRRPRMIRGRASCPVLRAAFRANRFIEGKVDIPVHTWPATLGTALRVHLTLNHSDEPLRPYQPAPTSDGTPT